MKKMFLTSVAVAAAMSMAPGAMAQDNNMTQMTTQQQTMYDGWPAENRTAYDAWPAEVRTYYWTLTEPQTKAWWRLTDEQRVTLYRMDPTQRRATWTSIEQQMAQTSASTSATAPASSAATTSARATTPAATTSAAGNMQYRSGEVTQRTATAARTGDYPICSATVTDGCIQPRAAGKNYGNRPLNYWPGQSASEMKKPTR